MLFELERDLLGHIISFACQHEVLCICAQASSKLRTEAMFIMQHRYADEGVMIQRIIGKLRLQDCFHVAHHHDWTSIRFKSVEWLKHMLGWVDDESSHRNHNDMIRDAFYCDCPWCFNTLPCGRGYTQRLSTHEESLLHSHFQIKWWIN